MEKKKRMLAVAVTTREAMDDCVIEEIPVFCIENPLYSTLCGELGTMESLKDYDITDYKNKQVAVLRKRRGKRIFREDEYELFYAPLQWKGWTS